MTFRFYSTVTWFRFFDIFVDNIFVVKLYHGRHALWARIGNFYSVSVENCVTFIRFWKVLIYQIESFSNVGGNVFVKKWIKPGDVTGPISFLFFVFLICIS